MPVLLLLLIFFIVPYALHAENPKSFQNGAEKQSLLGVDELFAAVITNETSLSLEPEQENRSTSDLNDFGDYTIQDALIRFPGFQTGGDRQLNMLGVGRKQFHVTLDGIPMANSFQGDRFYDLSRLSTDIVEQIEVIRIRPPDMHAEGLAGTVSLKTYSTAGETRDFSVLAGGGANTHYFNHTGPSSRFFVKFRDDIREDLGVAATINHHFDHRGRDVMGFDYGVAHFEDDPFDVLESHSVGLQTDENSRLGATIQLNFDPDDYRTFYLNALANRTVNDRVRHTDSRHAGGDWVDPVTTGATGELGYYLHDASQTEIESEQFQISAGGRHQYEVVEWDYHAGWSYNKTDASGFRFPFVFDEIDFNVDMQNRERPFMEIVGRPILILDDNSINRNFIIGEDFKRTLSDFTDHTLSGDLSVSIPLEWLNVKLGSSVLMKEYESAYQESSFENVRTLRMERFLMEEQRNVSVMDGDYTLPWLVKTDDTRSFLQSQRPNFSKDENQERYASDIHNFNASEQIYGTYVMADTRLGEFALTAGVRVEHTASDYEGMVVHFDQNGDHISSEPEIATVSYTDMFPHLHLISHHLGGGSRIGLAYSRSIARPDFHSLAPFERTNPMTQTRFIGNPDLDPMISDNLDLYLDYNISYSGKVGMNLFYKNLSGLFIEKSERIQGGSYDGWTEHSFDNAGSDADLYGVELHLQQQLGFLPGFLSNVKTSGNYTWSDSGYTPGQRDEEMALLHQSNHVVNVALGYVQGRFDLQIAYHWTDNYLAQYRKELSLAPSLHGSTMVYMDEYEDGWSDLSVSFRFRISQNFRFWADGYNLINTEWKHYALSRSDYPRNISYRDGIGFRMGIRYDL